MLQLKRAVALSNDGGLDGGTGGRIGVHLELHSQGLAALRCQLELREQAGKANERGVDRLGVARPGDLYGVALALQVPQDPFEEATKVVALGP